MQEMAPHIRPGVHQTPTSSAAPSGASSAANQDPSTYWDSDFEADRDPPDWRVFMSQEELGKLKQKERKRQDVINGKSCSFFLLVAFSSKKKFRKIFNFFLCATIFSLFFFNVKEDEIVYDAKKNFSTESISQEIK